MSEAQGLTHTASVPPPFQLTWSRPGGGDRLVLRVRALQGVLISEDQHDDIALLIGSTETDETGWEVAFVVDFELCAAESLADRLGPWGPASGRQAWAVGLFFRSPVDRDEYVAPLLRQCRKLLPHRLLVLAPDGAELAGWQWDGVKDSFSETGLRFARFWPQFEAGGFRPFEPYFLRSGEQTRDRVAPPAAVAPAVERPKRTVDRSQTRTEPAGASETRDGNAAPADHPPRENRNSQPLLPPKDVEPVALPVVAPLPSVPVGPVRLTVARGIPTWVKIAYTSCFLTALVLGVLYMSYTPSPQVAAPTPSSPSPLPLGLEANLRDQVLEIYWNPDAPVIRTARIGQLVVVEGSQTRTIHLSIPQLRAGRLIYLPESGDMQVTLSIPTQGASVQETLRVLRSDRRSR